MVVKPLLFPIFGGRQVEACLEIVIESGRKTKARGGSYFGNLHIRILEQDTSVIQSAVADKIGHRSIVTALSKSPADLDSGQVVAVAHCLTIELRVKIELVFANVIT